MTRETQGKDAKNVSDLIICDKHKKHKCRVCDEREKMIAIVGVLGAPRKKLGSSLSKFPSFVWGVTATHDSFSLKKGVMDRSLWKARASSAPCITDNHRSVADRCRSPSYPTGQEHYRLIAIKRSAQWCLCSWGNRTVW